jgi:hypothetical protein
MTSYADYFGVLTHIDPLLFYKTESHDSWTHREISVKRDLLLNKYIHQLDAKIFQELPIFAPDILGSDKEMDQPDTNDLNPEENSIELDSKDLIPKEYSHVLPEWQKEKYSELCIRFFDAARTHKWCIIQLYDDTPYWRVFTYREVKEIKYDEEDNPISAKVMWAKHLPRADSYNLHKEDLNFVREDADTLDKAGNAMSQALFVNFGTDLDTRIETTDIEHIWSLDVYLRYVMLDIVRNSAQSSGFYWIKEGSQMDDDKKEQLQEVFNKAGGGRMVGASENVIQEMQAMYMPHPEFAIEAYDKLLKAMAGGCNLPLIYFNGEKEEGSIFAENSGAMEQVNDKMKEIFGKFKDYILKIVEMRWGITCDDVFPNLEEEKDEQYSEDIIEPRAEPGNGAAKKNNNVKVNTK